MSQVGIRFSAGVEYKGNIYLSAIGINGLFRLDTMTEELSYVKRFEKESPCNAIHVEAFLYGNEAWFIPKSGHYIAVVNLDTLHITYLEPLFHKINPAANQKSLYSSGGVIEGRYLYLVPSKLDTLLVVDMKTKQFYPYYDIVLGKEFFVQAAYFGGKIYMPPVAGNHLLELNLQTGEKNYHKWDFPDDAFAGVTCEKNKIWFVPWHSKFFFNADLNTGQVEYFELGNFYDKEFTYNCAVRFGVMLYFIPYLSDKILKFNMLTKELLEYKLEADLLEDGRNVFRKIYSPNRLILESHWKSNSTILLYDEENDTLKKIKPCMERNVLIKEMKEICGGDISVLAEFIRDDIWIEECLTLEGFIQIGLESEKEAGQQNCTGQKVWNELKRQIMSL